MTDPQAWRAWWERNKRLLEPEYDLRTTAGINVWLEAAAKAEPDVQKILLKLWEFAYGIFWIWDLEQPSPAALRSGPWPTRWCKCAKSNRARETPCSGNCIGGWSR